MPKALRAGRFGLYLFMSQKGVSLFLTIIILSIILSIVLGLSTILVGQIKTIRVIGHSVVALYTADSGIEQTLKAVLDHMALGSSLDPTYSGFVDLDGDSLETSNDASYKAEVVCCGPPAGPICYYNAGNVCPITVNTDCVASYFCMRSVGTYKNTKRAIEIEL